MNLRWLSLITILIPVIGIIYMKLNKGPPQFPPHKYVVLEDFLDNKSLDSMRKLFQDLETFPTATSDWTSQRDIHIGEASDPNENGKCPSNYLMYNKDLKKCIFPNRIDVGRWFLLTGGYDGWKDKYDILVSRSHPFINFQFNTLSRPEFIELFEDKRFKKATLDICGVNKPYFRPFQLSMIIQIPGQTVAAHLDVPFFLHASRYFLPQWLLLVMQESHLFSNKRIAQVQALVYIHDWKNDFQNYSSYSGEFILYPNGPKHSSKSVIPKPGNAIFCDGSEQVHATATFRPDITPINIDKDIPTALKWDQENNVWRLYVNNTLTLYKYSWSEVRSSIAYRGWCFDNEYDKINYDPHLITNLTLNDILETLKNDLINKRKYTKQQLNNMNAHDFGLTLLNSYIKLPYSEHAWIPYNYCMIFRLLPSSLEGLSSYFENLLC